MTFVIGDIHGEITKLKDLMKHLLKFGAKKLIFIGDYINKGENSKLTLDYLVQLSQQQNVIFLMGNHEYMLLEYMRRKRYKQQLMKYTLTSTIEDFSVSFDNLEKYIYSHYQNFFDSLELYYETEKYFISHAGIDIKYINQSLDVIPEEAFLFSRYDFIRSKLMINDKIFIFGHTAFSYPFYDGTKIGIDTAAVYEKNNPLTAYCLEKELFINSNNEIKYLREFNMNVCPIIVRNQPYRERKYNE